MRVALLVPCTADALRPEVGLATARVLRRLGHAVRWPAEQTCCGQPALNAGHFGEAARLAERLLRVLAAGEPEAIVCPSGSCVAALRKTGPRHLGTGHPALSRLFELTEFLTEVLGVTDVGAELPGTATFHDSCHPLRELGIREGPRRLLRAVRGLTLVEMDPPDECCGFGGLFSVKLPEVSAAMGDRKADAALATGADLVTGTELPCLLQIEGVLRRRGARMRALHVAEVLAGGAA